MKNSKNVSINLLVTTSFILSSNVFAMTNEVDKNTDLAKGITRLTLKEEREEIVRAVGEIADPVHQAQVMELADYIFNPKYIPEKESYITEPEFSLENRMAIFQAFLKSQHLVNDEAWDNSLFLYYIIHESLCNMGVEAEKTVLYLSDYVEKLEKWPTEDLVKLIRRVDRIYDTKCYSNLKGSQSCEDWMLLMQALQPLTRQNRKVLSEFIDWLPSSFKFGPADAIEQVLVPLLPSIDQLESFEVLEPFFIRAFKLYGKQEDQIVCIEEIIQGVKKKKSEQKIMKTIEKLLS